MPRVGRPRARLGTATIFLAIVPKLHPPLTFLATIESGHFGHEDFGHYFNSGTAHGQWSRHLRPASHGRSADRAASELGSVRACQPTANEPNSASTASAIPAVPS